MQQKSRQVNLRTFLLQFRTLQQIRKGQNPPAGGVHRRDTRTRTTCKLNVQQNSSIIGSVANDDHDHSEFRQFELQTSVYDVSQAAPVQFSVACFFENSRLWQNVKMP
jgi:hypothetical protein